MVTVAQVWEALAEVPDPEIPVISLVDLGVVRDVEVRGGRVRVELTPTFLGCPALEVMRDRMAAAIAGLAAKIDREEAYHRMHAEMWADRLGTEPRFRVAVESLWQDALGVLPDELRKEYSNRVGIGEVTATERGETTDDLRELWDEMTSVRRSIPGAQW